MAPSPPVRGHCLLAMLALGLCYSPPAPAQNRELPPLRLDDFELGGVRASVTESWGTFDVVLTNLSNVDRRGRVLASWVERPGARSSAPQYGRDVWIPAHSTIRTWMLVGPPTSQDSPRTRELRVLLYDLTDGGEKLLLPPDGRIRTRNVLYRKRELSTAVLVNEEMLEPSQGGLLPAPEPAADEVLRFARVFRHASNLSEYVRRVNPGPLPPTAEAFDGIDHFVVASGRLARDPDGLRALRRWLERGGKVWVMLDRIEPGGLLPILGALLGEAVDFTVVDRVSLDHFAVASVSAGEIPAGQPDQQHDRPVDFVRVLLPATEQVQHTVNGWPVWFSRQVGRGKLVFTTLGSRGWFLPRTPENWPTWFTWFKHDPTLPVPTSALEVLATAMQPPREESPFRTEAFRPLVAGEIGYVVIGRGTVGLVFGIFLLALLALRFVLKRFRRPELLGWLAPAAALVVACVFVALGESSRKAAPPTVAVAQFVDAVPGTGEVAIHGLLAVYRPDSGPAEAAAERGGLFELDLKGVEGPTRRLILSDRGAWHWENMSLPAGVLWAPFRYAAPTGAPLTAVARFGSGGLEGKLEAGPFTADLADAVLATPSGRNLALRLGRDGTFRAGPADILPGGQFLPGAVLSDVQQQRQGLYRKFLAKPGAALGGRNVLLAWSRPVDTHFRFMPGVRTVGTALLLVPLQLERIAPGARALIPGPFVTCQRIVRGIPTRLTREGRAAVVLELRFQLPPAVLPFEVERARLTVRIDAPSRRVSVSGRADGKAVEISRVESPLDPIRADIAKGRLLVLDDGGGLRLTLTVSDLLGGGRAEAGASQREQKWTIEYVELEVTGRNGQQ